MLSKLWNNPRWTITASALLLGLSFPPVDLAYLQMPAFVLLIRLACKSSSYREAAYRSYFVFVLWNIFTTYWLMMASFVAGVAAILANSALMTIPLVAMRLIQRRYANFWVISIGQAAIWTSYEYLHHQWDLAWPWLTLANAWSVVPELIQFVEYTGIWGISFWVVLMASSAYQLLVRPTEEISLATTAGFLSVLIAPLVLSAIIIYQYTDEPVAERTVLVGQPNFNSYETYGGFSDREAALQNLISISDSVMRDDVSAIFWPENAVRPRLISNERDGISRRLRQLSEQWDAAIISGTSYYQLYSEDEKPPLARTSGDLNYIFYNSAIGFYPDGEKAVYHKGNLVPIVERVPFLDALSMLLPIGVDWAEIGGMGRGKKQTLFQYEGISVPALVCYDSVFPSWVRGFVADGANMIAVITNDGWWGKTSGHIQHFAYARLRAIEFRRWVVRSANNGISGVITSEGDVLKMTEYKQKDAFTYAVPLLQYETFYALYGDWFAWAGLIISGVLLGLVSIRPSRQPDEPEKPKPIATE